MKFLEKRNKQNKENTAKRVVKERKSGIKKRVVYKRQNIYSVS